jgi:hypothetical protein
MRATPTLAVALIMAVASQAATAAIVRCESADGKVVYSNAECPPNTRLVRKVEQAPPVVVHDGAAAPADRNGKPSAAAIERARPKPPADPNQVDRQLTEQLAAQRRECEARLRQIEQLQRDLEAASDETRASAELALRRAQEDFRALCPRQR